MALICTVFSAANAAGQGKCWIMQPVFTYCLLERGVSDGNK